MPALYHLSREDLLPDKFRILGLGRRISSTDKYVLEMKARVEQYCSHAMEERFWKPLSERMESIAGADINEESTFTHLKDRIREIEEEWGRGANKVFFFATSPSHFKTIVCQLTKTGLNTSSDSNCWTRVIIEKPFGLNLRDADNLNNLLMEGFREDQVYRIDHFLGKESVQNILIFRLSNLMFQPLWNNKYIDHIQITTSETIGVEGRVDFFEQTGAVLDMLQSHILQILAFVTMEPPTSFSPEAIRDEKVILFRSIRRYDESEIEKYVVRGQYGHGVVKSKHVVGYREEDTRTENSLVETYAVLKLQIDNPRWRGVPIYLRTGKRMPERRSFIYIQLKRPDSQDIPMMLQKGQQPMKNSITIEIQPKGGVKLQLGWRPSGLLESVKQADLSIEGQMRAKEPKAYERLLVDVIRGDSTLFIRHDEVREMFKVVEPFLNHFKKEDELIRAGKLPDPFPNYHAGTQGPKAADEFIAKDGRSWVWIEPIPNY